MTADLHKMRANVPLDVSAPTGEDNKEQNRSNNELMTAMTQNILILEKHVEDLANAELYSIQPSRVTILIILYGIERKNGILL
jgi:hypothetical protein